MLGAFKKSGIYFDDKPTIGSDNAVNSDGIAKAIENVSYDDTELSEKVEKNSKDIEKRKAYVAGATNEVGGSFEVTFTKEQTDKEGFLIIRGWNTSGYSYRNLYFLSYEPRRLTPIIREIATGLGEITTNPISNIVASRVDGKTKISFDVLSNSNVGNGVILFPIPF